VNAYIVTWMRKPMAQPYLIDVNTPEMAAEITLRLAAMPLVYDVKVTEVPYEEDQEMKTRIWARIEARLRELPVFA
jgi:hypothetical protein